MTTTLLFWAALVYCAALAYATIGRMTYKRIHDSRPCGRENRYTPCGTWAWRDNFSFLPGTCAPCRNRVNQRWLSVFWPLYWIYRGLGAVFGPPLRMTVIVSLMVAFVLWQPFQRALNYPRTNQDKRLTVKEALEKVRKL